MYLLPIYMYRYIYTYSYTYFHIHIHIYIYTRSTTPPPHHRGAGGQYHIPTTPQGRGGQYYGWPMTMAGEEGGWNAASTAVSTKVSCLYQLAWDRPAMFRCANSSDQKLTAMRHPCLYSPSGLTNPDEQILQWGVQSERFNHWSISRW